MSGDLKICTINVRGLKSDATKRRDMFSWLRKKRLDIYLLQETHCSKQLEQYWRNEWGYKAFFSSYDTGSRGVAILFNNTFEHNIHNIHHDPEGRYLIIDISVFNQRISLLNVYAPNEDKPDFFTSLGLKLEAINNTSIICGGDFNVVQDYNIDTNNIYRHNNPKSNSKVHDIKADLDLIDPWRLHNPQTRMYTWHSSGRGTNKQSRLDYFLISSDLGELVNDTQIRPGYRTDHSLVTVSINFITQKRGAGIWKFNNSLLRDKTYVAEVKKCIKETLQQYCDYHIDEFESIEDVPLNINDQLFFEMLKLQIRAISIPYAAAKKRERQKQEKDAEIEINLRHRLYTESPNDENLETLRTAQDSLQAIRQKQVEGQMIRAKARWNLEGEKPSRYFLNLEKRHYSEKVIPKLITDDKKEITDIQEIIKEQTRFYKELYRTRKPKLTEKQKEMFFPKHSNLLKVLTEDQKQSCEGDLTQAECLTTLKNMKNNKSPGPDGYTVEFFKFFWKDLGYFLVKAINEGNRIGKLSVTQRLGQITCLPKPNRSKLYMKNWRPITLLNVDYKIASGSIANRIKNNIGSIVSDSQKGFVKGRYMGECIRLVYDVIQKIDEKKINGTILLIDFEKAFDSLEWSFIDKSLEYFGFGPLLRKWITTFYTDVESFIMNNGHCSSRFIIERGVRQGDPLSALLFILAVEFLAAALKENPNIKGIEIDNTEYLISQFADDTTMLLNDDEKTFQAVVDTLDDFAKCSGLKINYDKTKAVRIKANSNYHYLPELKIQWKTRGKFTLLGIEFDLDKIDITETNYLTKIESVKRTLNTWIHRNLTILGKITIIKTLALSQLVNLFTVLPNPPQDKMKELETLFFKFTWGNKRDKIKRTVMINTKENGGFKFPHILSFCNSQKISWIKRLHDLTNISEWKVLFCSNMEKYGGNYIWLCKNNNRKILNSLNPFWKDVYAAWINAQSAMPHQENYLEETLFFNDNIKMGGEPIYIKSWFQAGIQFVNDLVKNDGNFMSLQELNNTFMININFLQYHGIKRAIPKIWKEKIQNEKKKLVDTEPVNIKYIKQLKKPGRFFYEKMIEKIAKRPQKSQGKWEKDLGIEISENEWAQYYKLPYNCSNETKITVTQTKILHRIISTNKILYKMKLSATNTCTFCEFNVESIQHLIWECPVSRSIWLALSEWLEDNNVNHNITKTVSILGDIEPNTRLKNRILLITKQVLLNCKYNNIPPTFNYVLQTIKHKYKVDKYTFPDAQLNKMWHPLIDTLDIP